MVANQINLSDTIEWLKNEHTDFKNVAEALFNFNYEDYDLTSIESNFILKREAIKRIVKGIYVYEAKADAITNKEIDDYFCKIIIIRLYVVDGHNRTILYNPNKGNYIYFHDSLLKFDEKRRLFAHKTRKPDITNEYNLPDEPDNSYAHATMIYYLAKGKLQIPKMKKDR
jgi:hypothetical protein